MECKGESNHQSSTKNVVQELRRKEITILMIGETGVGKSTFINAIVNYFMFDNMSDAAENLTCLIPTSFEIYDDKSMEMKECYFGDPDDNECDDKSQSCTQACKCYNIEIGDFTLKIIDTPGIADCRGVARDKLNLKNLLNFLSSYKELNAICVLLKPNNAKVGVLFKYCILELLTHFNKSASENLVFLFTHSRGTFYRPGDTAKPLRKVLSDIQSKPPHVHIKFDAETCFCFDSESFRYLVAISEPNNFVFDGSAHDDFERSWQRSVSECRRLFKHILDLKPHDVQDTISINNVKNKIINLRKPILSIAQHIQMEIILCENHERKIEECSDDIQELEKVLYTPALDIIADQLDKPITVCGDPECCEKKSIGDTTKVHYKSPCHKPCYLKNSDENIVGNSALLDCVAFNKYKRTGRGRLFDAKTFHPDCEVKGNKNGLAFGWNTFRTKSETCFECSHSYLVHLTINYETKVQVKQIRDENKVKRIEMSKATIDERQNQIGLIKAKVKELKEELRFITECSAYFANFLMNNAITPFNDALEEYINFCIVNERRGNADAAVIDSFQAMLNSYVLEKEEIQKLLANGCDTVELTSEKISGKISQLFTLQHYGPSIKIQMDMEEHGQLKSAIEAEKKVVLKNGSHLTASVKHFFSHFKMW